MMLNSLLKQYATKYRIRRLCFAFSPRAQLRAFLILSQVLLVHRHPIPLLLLSIPFTLLIFHLILFPILYVGARIWRRCSFIAPSQMDFITGLAEVEAASYDEPPPRNWVERVWNFIVSVLRGFSVDEDANADAFLDVKPPSGSWSERCCFGSLSVAYCTIS